MGKAPDQNKNEKIEKYLVLEYNRISMGWLGMRTKNLNDPSNEFFSSLMSYYVLFIVVSFTIMSSVVYMYLNKSHFEIISESSLVAIAGVQVAGMFLTIGINNMEVKALFLKLQSIVDKGNFNISF